MVEKEKTAEKNPEDNISEADEKAGEALMEKILNAMKDAPKVVEAPIVDKEKEYAEKLARHQADFDNFRKRTEKEKQENLMNANADLISELLSVLDHFELALKHNKDKGVQMIYDELVGVLGKEGLKLVNSTGKFNPKIHEAVIKEEGKEDGIILEEIQKGYLLNERLLRASKVKVSKIKEQK